MPGFDVRSPEFGRGQRLPTRFVHEKARGQNVSPPLQFDGVPDNASSIAFAMVDRDQDDFVKWMVVDLPAENGLLLDEGASPDGLPEDCRELYNDGQFAGYYGPNPPPRSGEHRYEIIAYALDIEELEIDDHAGPGELEEAVGGHVLDEADTYWVYEQR